jgi:two-component system response regulator DesR
MTDQHVARLRVLVVDEQEIVTWGFRLLLTRAPWVERCVTAVTGEQARAYARRFGPHVALVNLFVNDEPGVSVARAIRELSPPTRVILMSDSGKIAHKAVRAAGAAGYLSKGWRPEDLACAVRVVGLGLNLTPPREEETNGSERLSRRERDVLTLIAQGATNAEIGKALSLSLHTVKQHASAIFHKLGARNRAEAVQHGEMLGYIE